MAYDQDIPQPEDVLSQSQGQILANFQSINSESVGFGVDHVKFNAISSQGQHKQVTLNTFGAAPFSVASNQSYIYSANASTAGTQLRYQPSVVNFGVPISPRVIGRIKASGAGWVQDNGPFGAGTNFNTADPSGGSFDPVFNFAQTLGSTDYFQYFMIENGINSSIEMASKTNNSITFKVSFGGPASIILIVY